MRSLSIAGACVLITVVSIQIFYLGVAFQPVVYPWLAVIAMATGLLGGWVSYRIARSVLHLCCLTSLGVLLFANMHISKIGFVLSLAGLTSNIIVSLANGAKMPFAGPVDPSDKDYVAMSIDTRLWFLADHLYFRGGLCSIGDIFIAGGFWITALEVAFK